MALGDGTAWNESAPADSDNIKDGADEIRDVRVGVSLRLGKEHTVPAGSTAGGEHTEGSAVGYYESAAPTNRPDGGAAGYSPPVLDPDDAGRIWLDSDDKVLYIWNGSAWNKAQTPDDGIITPTQGTTGSTKHVIQTIFNWTGDGNSKTLSLLPSGASISHAVIRNHTDAVAYELWSDGATPRSWQQDDGADFSATLEIPTANDHTIIVPAALNILNSAFVGVCYADWTS